MDRPVTDQTIGRRPKAAADRPVVYGSPLHLALWIDSVRRLLDHEPDEVIADAKVRHSARQLAGLLVDRRLVDGPMFRPGTERIE